MQRRSPTARTGRQTRSSPAPAAPALAAPAPAAASTVTMRLNVEEEARASHTRDASSLAGAAAVGTSRVMARLPMLHRQLERRRWRERANATLHGWIENAPEERPSLDQLKAIAAQSAATQTKAQWTLQRATAPNRQSNTHTPRCRLQFCISDYLMQASILYLRLSVVIDKAVAPLPRRTRGFDARLRADNLANQSFLCCRNHCISREL